MSSSSSSSSSITTSPNTKKMVSSPLSSSTITPYSKEQLSEILLGETTIATSEYSYVDIGLLAEIVSERIISSYASIPETPSHYPLSSFIYPILFASSFHITVLISTLAHIDEFHLMMSDFEPRGAYDFDEACRLFLAAYMTAARAVYGELSHLTFWAKVVGGRYTAFELCSMEFSFVDMMRGAGPAIESLLDDDDSETEGTLVQSESDTDNDSDEEVSSPAKDTIPPVVVAAYDPAMEKAKALAKAKADVVTVLLRIAANRLKAGARQKSPAYAQSSSLLESSKETKEGFLPLEAIVSEPIV